MEVRQNKTLKETNIISTEMLISENGISIYFVELKCIDDQLKLVQIHQITFAFETSVSKVASKETLF